MANAVDDAGSPKRDPHDLRRQDQRARHDAEEDDVHGPHQGQAEDLIPRVEMTLEPIVRSPVAVALEGLGLAGFLDVEEHATPQHAVDPEHLRAVWIFRRIALRVVLAMHRGPLTRYHTRGQPEPEPEER